MDKRYDCMSHAKIKIMYHVVLATKYRKRCLLHIEDRVYESCRRASEMAPFEILDAGIDDGNHIHLLIRIRKQDLTIGRVVSLIKSVTTRDMWERYPFYLKSSYGCGGKKKLWSNGYFAETVGHGERSVSRYIYDQADGNPCLAKKDSC